MKALGFVEVSGVVAAVDCMDIMCKSANVSFVTWERKLGGRLVTIIVEGSVSDVTEAVKCAQRQCVSKVVASNVIAAPHSETVRLVELSASRIARLQQAKEQKQKEAQNQGQEPLAEQKEAQTMRQEPLAEQQETQNQGQEPLAEQQETQNQGQEPLAEQKKVKEQTPAVSEAPAAEAADKPADSGVKPKSTRSRTRKAKEKQDSDESGTK